MLCHLACMPYLYYSAIQHLYNHQIHVQILYKLLQIHRQFTLNNLAKQHICLIIDFQRWGIELYLMNSQIKDKISNTFTIDKDYVYMPFISSKICDCNNYGGFGNQLQIGFLTQSGKERFLKLPHRK